MKERAVSGVIGTVLLTVITVVIASSLMYTVNVGLNHTKNIHIEILSINTTINKVIVLNMGSDEVAVSDICVKIFVNETPLKYCLDGLPAYGVQGFHGVGGVFSAFSSDHTWSPGDYGSFNIGKNNIRESMDREDGLLHRGDKVEIYVSMNGFTIGSAIYWI